MLALSQKSQAAFVGVRSTFYRLAMIAGQGGLVYLAGMLSDRTGQPVTAWRWCSGCWRWLRAARRVALLGAAAAGGRPAGAQRPHGRGVLARLPRRLRGLLPQARHRARAGLPAAVPLCRGAAAEAGHALHAGPARGRRPGPEDAGRGHRLRQLRHRGAHRGRAAGRLADLAHGPEALLWPLVLCMHLPNLAYVALALWQPQGLAVVSTAIAVEQFGSRCAPSARASAARQRQRAQVVLQLRAARSPGDHRADARVLRVPRRAPAAPALPPSSAAMGASAATAAFFCGFGQAVAQEGHVLQRAAAALGHALAVLAGEQARWPAGSRSSGPGRCPRTAARIPAPRACGGTGGTAAAPSPACAGGGGRRSPRRRGCRPRSTRWCPSTAPCPG
jgi:hypothetical protein